MQRQGIKSLCDNNSDYSRVNNWNSSKVSELEARTKGNYWQGNRRDADGQTAEALSHR